MVSDKTKLINSNNISFFIRKLSDKYMMIILKIMNKKRRLPSSSLSLFLYYSQWSPVQKDVLADILRALYLGCSLISSQISANTCK